MTNFCFVTLAKFQRLLLFILFSCDLFSVLTSINGLQYVLLSLLADLQLHLNASFTRNISQRIINMSFCPFWLTYNCI